MMESIKATGLPKSGVMMTITVRIHHQKEEDDQIRNPISQQPPFTLLVSWYVLFQEETFSPFSCEPDSSEPLFLLLILTS